MINSLLLVIFIFFLLSQIVPDNTLLQHTILLCQTYAAFQVHEPDFVSRFSQGTLSEPEMRRIGFGEVTRHPHLIERTKAEVAGHMLHVPYVAEYPCMHVDLMNLDPCLLLP